MQAEYLINRALGMVGQGTKYKLGRGGMNPNLATPAPKGECDCTGFIAWCFGISRKTNNPFYMKYMNGWFETSVIYKDVGHTAGLFEQLVKPRAGAIIVFGDYTTSSGRKEGHIGLITSLNNNAVQVVHCSSGNDKNGDAIQVTDDSVFRNHKPLYGWWSGLPD
jgi:hypothetical protein